MITKQVAEATTTPLLFINFNGHPLSFSTLDFVLLIGFIGALLYIIFSMRTNAAFRPVFYTKIREAMTDGDFWLAAAVAFTALAPNIPAPYSTYCYIGTFVGALYGAALRSDRHQDNHDDHDDKGG
jgi:hypothetical protein